MPNGFPAEASNVNVPTTTATTVLTIVSGFDDIDLPDALRGSVIGAMSTSCTIRGTMNISAGTATTSVQIRCFNQNGTQVGPLQASSPAVGVATSIPFQFRDLNPRGTAQYTIQVTQVAATGNGTVNDICASADMQG